MSRTPLQDMVRELFGVVEGICPCCNKEVVQADFKDALSKKEYEISGMCQKCQDKVFAEPSEEEELL